jgi:hypothetical protein
MMRVVYTVSVYFPETQTWRKLHSKTGCYYRNEEEVHCVGMRNLYNYSNSIFACLPGTSLVKYTRDGSQEEFTFEHRNFKGVVNA